MTQALVLGLFVVVSASTLGLETALAASEKTPRKVSRADARACERIATQSPTADPRVLMAHAIGQGLDMARLRGRLEELSGEKPMPNGKLLKERGSDEGRDTARARISEMLEEMGYRPMEERFDNGVNLIAEIKGSKNPEQVIELTAHYDSVENPGADDNGSGIALLLELAAYLPQFKPEVSVRFTFMDLEERGRQGSRYHARKMAEDRSRQYLGTIVVDTIGWAQDGGEHFLAVVEVGEPRQQDSPRAYQAQEKLAAEMFYLLSRIGKRDGLQFSPETKDAMPFTADHGSYWEYGLPAILIAAPYESGFINPHYHKPTDKIEFINWKYYELVAKSIAELVAYQTHASVRLKISEIKELAAIENQQVDIYLGVLDVSLARDPVLPPKPKIEELKPAWTPMPRPKSDESPSLAEEQKPASPRPNIFSSIRDFFWGRK